MNAKTQRLCVWSGMPMMGLLIITIGPLAHFLPPPSPGLSAEDNARIFAENSVQIRLGLMLAMFAAALLGPFFAVITVQMRRIESGRSPLAYAQLCLAPLLIFEFLLPMIILQACAFRSERPAVAIQAMSDVAWFIFVSPVSTAMVQMILVGIAVLRDRREEPVLPRWSGYFSLWVALLVAPGAVCVFFKSGPFAWPGIFCFWVPLVVFGVWVLGMTRVMLQSIKREEVETTTLAPSSADEATLPAVVVDTLRQVELYAAEVAALRAELARVSAPAE